MRDHRQNELIRKLFHDTCSTQELEQLLEIVRNSPEPVSNEIVEKLWDEMGGHPQLETSLSSDIYRKIVRKVNFESDPKNIGGISQHSMLGTGKSKKMQKLTRIAAVFLLLVFSLGWFLVSGSQQSVISTAYGEQKSLKLSDGSRVELNANSKMRFTPNWMDDENREIWLKGEAFFEVEKKPSTKQKFQVITEDIVVEVYGTTFNVNNHGDRTSVYLEEGEVRLYIEALDSIVLMDEGDLITYWKSDHKIIRKRKELALVHTSWKDGVLTFDEASLGDVVRRFENIYGVKFKIINEEYNARELNIPLPVDDLQTAISILEKTMMGLEIQKEGELYIIQ